MDSGQKYLVQSLIIKHLTQRQTPQRADWPARTVSRASSQREDKAKYLTIKDCQVGCPIRKSLDHGLLPAPQRLSQVITSFIASDCLGIHQTPFSRLIRSRRNMIFIFAAKPRMHKSFAPSSMRFRVRFWRPWNGLWTLTRPRKSHIIFRSEVTLTTPALVRGRGV